jgi:hypothetical protein
MQEVQELLLLLLLPPPPPNAQNHSSGIVMMTHNTTPCEKGGCWCAVTDTLGCIERRPGPVPREPAMQQDRGSFVRELQQR